MPPSSLDLKDKRILYELDLDARQSISEIAKKVELSKQAVHYRIKRLVKNKVITSFFMMLDTKKIGYSFYDLFLQLQNMTKEKEKELIDFLKGMDTVGWIASTTGKWNLVIAIFTRDIMQFNESLNEIYNKFGNNIREKKFIIDMSAILCKNKYLVEPTSYLSKDEYYGNEEIFKLDKKDISLLKTLDTDPRMSILELSKQTGIAFDTIKRKLSKLKGEGVIQGFKIKIDPAAFGYEWHIVLIELNCINESEKLKFIKKLQQHKSVVFIINTVGDWNLMVDLHVENNAHFQEVLSEFKDEFGSIIKSYENLMVVKDHKTTYVPDGVFES
jgi:Lrp/AsnC family transcriptional regulator, leucine-responsive regulatory protein